MPRFCAGRLFLIGKANRQNLQRLPDYSSSRIRETDVVSQLQAAPTKVPSVFSDHTSSKHGAIQIHTVSLRHTSLSSAGWHRQSLSASASPPQLSSYVFSSPCFLPPRAPTINQISPLASLSTHSPPVKEHRTNQSPFFLLPRDEQA